MLEEAVILAERGGSRRRREVVDEIDSLLSEQSLAKCASFAGKTLESSGAVVADLYLLLTFSLLRNVYLGVSKLLKTCRI